MSTTDANFQSGLQSFEKPYWITIWWNDSAYVYTSDSPHAVALFRRKATEASRSYVGIIKRTVDWIYRIDHCWGIASTCDKQSTSCKQNISSKESILREQSTFLGRKACSSKQTNLGKQSSSCKESNSKESITITHSNSSKVTEDEQNEQLYMTACSS